MAYLYVPHDSYNKVIVSPFNINLLVFIIETHCVHCEILTERLYVMYNNLSPERLYNNSSTHFNFTI